MTYSRIKKINALIEKEISFFKEDTFL